MTWNDRFKKIRIAFEIDRYDVVAICAAGGLKISSSLADGWVRSTSDDRFRQMSEAEFDAFCAGLVYWSKTEKPKGDA